MKRPLLCCLLLWSGMAAGAGDVADLYDDATLRYWGERYRVSTSRILDELIWPALRPAEQRQLGGRPRLEFPRFARGEARANPLAFYVPGDGRRIVFPVLSLKFLDDLCTAYAWLQLNGYALETISEYSAILRHGTPPRDGWPAPLEALGVPPNALEDPRVDELALGHFVTARTFLLLHEMGHVLYRHRASTYEESVRNEREADAFAVRVMPRTGLPPLGILVFFLADAHWSGFPASGQDTHPLTGERVRALAAAVEAPELAAKLRTLGTILDDPDIRRGFAATGKAGDLALLAPRRPGELPARAPKRGTAAGGRAFEGIYRGRMTQYSEPGSFPVEMHLQREGDRVRGQYSFGLGAGTIDGRAQGNVLRFDWTWAGNYGRGVLTADEHGAFEGSWGYRESERNAGTWNGQKLR